jgi:hypothetical protein
MSSAEHEEMLSEIKELRRVIHAGLTVVTAQLMQIRDQNESPSKPYLTDAFLELQTALGILRQGD